MTAHPVPGVGAADLFEGAPGFLNTPTYGLPPRFTVSELGADALLATAADHDVVVASVVQSADGAVLDTDALRAAVTGTDTLWCSTSPRRPAGSGWPWTGPTSRSPRPTSGCSSRAGWRSCR